MSGRKEEMEGVLTASEWTTVQIYHSSAREGLLPDEISDLSWEFGEESEGVEDVEALGEEFLVCVW
jgi:hypothetical protein